MAVAETPELTLDRVHPGRIYLCKEIAAMFRVSQGMVRDWVHAGMMRSIPRTKNQPIRCTGTELLRFAGMGPAEQPEPEPKPATETMAQRMARGKATLKAALEKSKQRRTGSDGAAGK
mgnify:CR=1 FL=1